MKKIISSILAVLMLVSLCAAFNVAAEDPTHELKAVVMNKDNSNAFRFIFDLTKEEMAGFEGVNVDDIKAYGYEIHWGISDKAEGLDWGADFQMNWQHGEYWGFDDNGNLW